MNIESDLSLVSGVLSDEAVFLKSIRQIADA